MRLESAARRIAFFRRHCEDSRGVGRRRRQEVCGSDGIFAYQRTTDLLACQLLLYIPDDSVHRDVHFRTRAAGEYLNLFFRELLADVDAIGNSDQVGVLELHSRTLVAVVKQHVDTNGLQRLGDLLGARLDLLVLRVGRRNEDLERRDVRGYPEAVLVIILLDARGQDAL